MTQMIILFSALMASFVMLIWSADRLVIATVSAAQKWRISPALAGMTLLAVGTSLPEIMISAVAARTDNLNMAVANLQGSNIANLGLVLGLVLLVAPLKNRFEPAMAFMLGLSAMIFWLVIGDLTITRLDGVLLLIGSLAWVYGLTRKAQHDRLHTPQPDGPPSMRLIPLWIGLLLGLVLISAHALVWSATGIAQSLGISERLIGLTLLAVGSSLPELVTTLAAARRAEHGLVLGNLAGSNIINLLLGGGLLAVLGPGSVTAPTRSIDATTMVLLTLGVVFLWWWKDHRQDTITRSWGFLLVACYTVFIVVNFGLTV